LLDAAHKVDGIVKGLKQRDWPQDSWQALHRLAMQLCQACMTQTSASGPKSTKIAA
jgi:DNA polymerase III subunit delta